MTLPVLPREVFDEIFSELKDEISTLKSCSLVCHSFCRKAQKMLFNSIDVTLVTADGTDGGPTQPTTLVLIVEHAPHLIEHIHKLHVLGDYGPLDVDRNAADLSDALGIFSRKGEFPINLRSLVLGTLQWHNIPSVLQDALVLLMNVHSLRDISLNHVVNCPASLVQNLPPLLKYLSLTDTTFSSLPTTRKELAPKLESFSIFIQDLLTEGFGGGLGQFPSDAVERIVDMSQLKTFQGGDCNPYSMPVIEQILRPASNSLEHLILQFNITDPDSISIMDLYQFPHLTCITIPNFCVLPDSLYLIPSTLIWITKTMKRISHRNVFQSLSLCLLLGPEVDIVEYDSALKDVWQELDAICSIPQLALSKSFRGMTFSIQSTVPKCDAFSDLVRNRLPETMKASKLHVKTSHCSFQLAEPDMKSQDGTGM